MTTVEFSLDNTFFFLRKKKNLRLIQGLNWSKNNFDEIHISQGLDWAFPRSVSAFFRGKVERKRNTRARVKIASREERRDAAIFSRSRISCA